MRPWTVPADYSAAGREIGRLMDLIFDGLTREDFMRVHPYSWSPYKHYWYTVRHPRRKPGSLLAEFREKIFERDTHFHWVPRHKPYRPGRPRKPEPWPDDPNKALDLALRNLDIALPPEDLEDRPYV